jgi:hypothetical protein
VAFGDADAQTLYVTACMDVYESTSKWQASARALGSGMRPLLRSDILTIRGVTRSANRDQCGWRSSVRVKPIRSSSQSGL